MSQERSLLPLFYFFFGFARFYFSFTAFYCVELLCLCRHHKIQTVSIPSTHIISQFVTLPSNFSSPLPVSSLLDNQQAQIDEVLVYQTCMNIFFSNLPVPILTLRHILKVQHVTFQHNYRTKRSNQHCVYSVDVWFELRYVPQCTFHHKKDCVK